MLAILPAGVEVVAGQDNRVPEPEGADFVVMTPIGRQRLATNIDAYADNAFVGSITETTLTIAEVIAGVLAVGNIIAGANVTIGTVVTALGTGTGGVGTYTVSPAQTAASGIISAGSQASTQKTKVTVQLDVHGPNSADNAETIATLFRDPLAVSVFLASGFDVTPLYTEEPRQIPFINAEQAYETRWVVDAVMQANQVSTAQVAVAPIQFASTVSITLKNVSATDPAN